MRGQMVTTIYNETSERFQELIEFFFQLMPVSVSDQSLSSTDFSSFNFFGSLRNQLQLRCKNWAFFLLFIQRQAKLSSQDQSELCRIISSLYSSATPFSPTTDRFYPRDLSLIDRQLMEGQISVWKQHFIHRFVISGIRYLIAEQLLTSGYFNRFSSNVLSRAWVSWSVTWL